MNVLLKNHNNIKMMSIPELDKAKRELTALQEAHDTINMMAKERCFPKAYQDVMGDLTTLSDEKETEILSIEKEYGGE